MLDTQQPSVLVVDDEPLNTAIPGGQFILEI